MLPPILETCANPSAATPRAANGGFSAEEPAAASFGEQLRLAAKPADAKTAATSDEKASPSTAAPRDAEQCEKPRREKEPRVDADATEGAGNPQTIETGPQAVEVADSHNEIDDAGRREADVQLAATLDDQTAAQNQRPFERRDAAAQDSQTTLPAPETELASMPTQADATLTASINTGANRPEETSCEGEQAVSEQSRECESVAAEPESAEPCDDFPEPPEVVKQGSKISESRDEKNADAAPAEAAAGDSAALPQIAVVAGENKASAKQEINKRSPAESGGNSNKAEGQTAPATPPAGGESAPADTELATRTTAEKLSAHVSGKKESGDSKTAGSDANPAETPIDQRGAVGRDSRAAAPPQTDAGEKGDQIDRVRFVQRVAKAFEGLGRDGGTLRIRLHPAELGSLRLEVAVRNGALTARLETDTQAAKNILLDNLPALRDRLEQQNIKIERFDVDYSDAGGDGSPQGAGDYHQPDRQPERGQLPPQTTGNHESGGAADGAATMARRLGAASQFDAVA